MSLFLRSSKLTAQAIRSSTRPRTKPAFPINQKNFVRTFQNTAVNMSVDNLANKKEFDDAIKNTDKPIVVLDAFATWCGPCKVIAPTVAKYAKQFPDVHFVKLDVDDVPDVASELGIRAMPTFVIFKKGNKVAEIVGADPKALLDAIEKVVAVKA